MATFRTFLKSIGYSYKRLRFLPLKEPNKVLYEQKRKTIQNCERFAKLRKIDLYFFDESGFSTSSNIPYAWSPIKQTKVIKSFFAKRFNVLGFLSKQGDLKSFIKEETVTSDTVIEVFDEFSKSMTKPTTVVLDNASFHKSKKFKANISRWANMGLTLLYLPPYSPQLNPIEILWKFIKYYWIEMSAYGSYTAMKQYVTKMLREYGVERVIDFKMQEEKNVPLLALSKTCY